VAHEEEWKAQEVHNFDESQWKGPDTHIDGWEVTPTISPVREVLVVDRDSGWPGLAMQVDDRCGTWPAFPSDTLEIEVTIEERTSVGDLTGEHSTCRLTVT
jgi:hypothetical protein